MIEWMTGDADRVFGRFANLERTGEFSRARTLDRMKQLLDRLDHPEKKLGRVFIVAGSKGKSSTALYLARVLRHSGLKTGLYISPHVDHWSERIQWDGAVLSASAAAPILEQMLPLVEAAGSDGNAPTYFEWMTAFAFLYFASMHPDATVLEVGLGGAFDATNTVDAPVAVITRMALEHQKVLGDSLAAITREKCGVIRPKACVITGTQEADALRVIQEFAGRNCARLVRVGDSGEVTVQSQAPRQSGQEVCVRGPWGADRFGTRSWGEHQAQNLALAVTAVRISGLARVHSDSQDTAVVLIDGYWQALPGRTDFWDGDIRLVIDGAHNAESAGALAASIRMHLNPRRVRLVLGVLVDKDPGRIFGALVNLPIHEIWAVTPKSERALPAAETAAQVRRAATVPVHEIQEACGALDAVFAASAPGDLVLVAGSLYLAGEARRWRSGHPSWKGN